MVFLPVGLHNLIVSWFNFYGQNPESWQMCLNCGVFFFLFFKMSEIKSAFLFFES